MEVVASYSGRKKKHIFVAFFVGAGKCLKTNNGNKVFSLGQAACSWRVSSAYAFVYFGIRPFIRSESVGPKVIEQRPFSNVFPLMWEPSWAAATRLRGSRWAGKRIRSLTNKLNWWGSDAARRSNSALHIVTTDARRGGIRTQPGGRTVLYI